MTEMWQEQHLLRDHSAPLPWLLFIIGRFIMTLLRMIFQRLPPPVLSVMEINMGAWRTQILYTVTHLGVADVLAKGPKTAEQLADAIGCKSEQLYRVMRAAVQLGIFKVARGADVHGRPRFQNNALSAVLREDHPNCLKHMVLHQTDHNKPAWDGLAWAVRTGGRPFERSHDGLDQFSWLKAHPAEEDKFSRAMSEIDAMGTKPITVDYKWNAFARIIDVGGAYGSFLQNLLEVNKEPAGLLFDQAQVITRARELWKEEAGKRELLDRVAFKEGDFFDHETLPAGKDGDVYVLRLILHDWNDADSAAILTNIRRAMGNAKAKLVIAETAIADEWNDPLFQRGLLDVHMMACLDGRERTITQWKALFAASGFTYSRFVPSRGIFSLVEAVPA